LSAKQKRNRILFLTLRVFSATGGIEKMCRILGRVFSEITEHSNSGIKVYSMYDSNSAAQSNTYFQDTAFSGFNKKKIHFAFYSILNARNADLIVLSHINLSLFGWIIKLIFPKKKIVLIAHGIEVWEIKSRLKKLFISSFDRIIAVSEFTKKEICKQRILQNHRIVVINNCLDPFLLEDDCSELVLALKTKYKIGKDTKVLFTLSRMSKLDRQKGYEKVIRALSLINHKQHNLIYIIAGRAQDDELGFLKKLIEKFYLENQVIIEEGYIDEKHLHAYYSMADLFIMPSTKEGFGVAYLEAMFYGTPVIAGNQDGSADALLRGEFGLLVDANDIDSIAEGIEKILSNPQRYHPNKSRLLTEFHYSKFKHQYEQLFLSLN
jgi:glycosyltransferase involved in cell wall biosynthesis